MTERERLIELLKNVSRNTRAFYDQFADYLLENGVIVLPVKVGDTVYEICERRRSGKWQKVIVERVVHGIEIGIDKILTARCGTTTYVYLSRLGKTVFPTKEEAEKALDGREKNEKKKYVNVDEVKLLILNYIRSIQMNDYGPDNGIPQLWSIMKQIDKMPTVRHQ